MRRQSRLFLLAYNECDDWACQVAKECRRLLWLLPSEWEVIACSCIVLAILFLSSLCAFGHFNITGDCVILASSMLTTSWSCSSAIVASPSVEVRNGIKVQFAQVN
jgi:hypothetical protein